MAGWSSKLLCAGFTLAIMSGSSHALFKICKNQTYALCASARCMVYDGVAYCKCDIKKGDSISLPFTLRNDQDVCSVNAEGVSNGYMISTYSPPESAASLTGNHAIYTCSGDSKAAYAQCDGGICFSSTAGKSFPGFGQLENDKIICSCPVTVPGFTSGRIIGYQILGPYPCDKSFFKYCKSSVANTENGSTIYVGAPTGVPKALALRLNGKIPPFNECRE